MGPLWLNPIRMASESSRLVPWHVPLLLAAAPAYRAPKLTLSRGASVQSTKSVAVSMTCPTRMRLRTWLQFAHFEVPRRCVGGSRRVVGGSGSEIRGCISAPLARRRNVGHAFATAPCLTSADAFAVACNMG